MRGEPGDAMARMKRWDAVRQRLADTTNVSAEAAVDDVVRAVSEVVHRHPSLTVTVTLDDSTNNVTVRIRNGDGHLEVTRIEPAPIVGEPRPAVVPPRIVATEPRIVAGEPRIMAGDPRAVTNDARVVNDPRVAAGEPHPAVNPPQAWPPRQSDPLPLRRPEGLPPAEPYGQPEPFRPAEQSRQGETMDQTAARLAEMIRRDPSLLDVRHLHDPEDRP